VPLPEMQSEDDGRSSVRLLRTRARPLLSPRGEGGPGWLLFRFARTRVPLSSEPRLAAEWDPARPRCRIGGGVVFLVALLPTLIAIWVVPGFVTQDGPAHLYNADIIARSRDPESPFRGHFRVRWEPLPNWTGHLTLAGLLLVLPPRAADRMMTS